MIARVGCVALAALAVALAAPILAAGAASGLASAGVGLGWAFAALGVGAGLAVVILAVGVAVAELEGRRLDAILAATDRQYYCPGCGRPHARLEAAPLLEGTPYAIIDVPHATREGIPGRRG